MKNLNPAWKTVRCEVRSSCVLRIIVWDYDRLSSPDLIGYLDVGPVERLAGMTGQHKLSPPPPPHKQEAGHIEFVAVSTQTQTLPSQDPIVLVRRWCQDNLKTTRAARPASQTGEAIPLHRMLVYECIFAKTGDYDYQYA
eukprot:CAMPEP_0202839704 /NCGR_PEP_ID=MMETSP1389-20130828/53483_1 /ASSEMBLY_ACC=CAM_ASM_000865 /TAXON_ID=302021 /ORGANISM="Rhodomonas sp., Strain CCMP768" /LENGTH=139 /DNA_ID=CAMNT_0049516209 /DNA_START=27 /DNA_END=450 /DNA_ORIENTATION=+